MDYMAIVGIVVFAVLVVVFLWKHNIKNSTFFASLVFYCAALGLRSDTWSHIAFFVGGALGFITFAIVIAQSHKAKRGKLSFTPEAPITAPVRLSTS